MTFQQFDLAVGFAARLSDEVAIDWIGAVDRAAVEPLPRATRDGPDDSKIFEELLDR